MSDHSYCMNCGKQLANKFCDECGQSAATHRFSLKHVFTHDLIHGLFHFDKGFFYTAKELITRPGYSIREYIDGRRAKHFNYITFLLLLVAAYVFFLTSGSSHFVDSMTRDTANKVNTIIHKFSKASYLIAIPLSAIATMLCFRRAHQNFAEHLVLNTYKSGGTLLINIAISLLAMVFDMPNILFLSLIGSVPFIYSIWFYNEYFKPDYPNKWARYVRSWCAVILLPLISFAAIFALLYLFYPEILQQGIENLRKPPGIKY